MTSLDKLNPVIAADGNARLWSTVNELANRVSALETRRMPVFTVVHSSAFASVNSGVGDMINVNWNGGRFWIIIGGTAFMKTGSAPGAFAGYNLYVNSNLVSNEATGSNGSNDNACLAFNVFNISKTQMVNSGNTIHVSISTSDVASISLDMMLIEWPVE